MKVALDESLDTVADVEAIDALPSALIRSRPRFVQELDVVLVRKIAQTVVPRLLSRPNGVCVKTFWTSSASMQTFLKLRTQP
jgi:hypothetical protein